MDRFIAGFPAIEDRDLMVCRHHGVAYQRDMTIRVPYDQHYFDKCSGYEDQQIALKINAGRIALVNKHVGEKAGVLDIGIGSGEFIKKRWPNTFGYDINPAAVEWLKRTGRWANGFCAFDAFTFWDVIEHVDDPNRYFCNVPDDGHVFVSLPIFDDLNRIRKSKHYRPGEHLYYWTEQGFVLWMSLYRFRMLERHTFEIEAGRENILSFAFRRVPA